MNFIYSRMLHKILQMYRHTYSARISPFAATVRRPCGSITTLVHVQCRAYLSAQYRACGVRHPALSTDQRVRGACREASGVLATFSPSERRVSATDLPLGIWRAVLNIESKSRSLEPHPSRLANTYIALIHVNLQLFMLICKLP